MRVNKYIILLFCSVGIMLCFTTCDQHPNINPLDPAYDETLGLTTSAPVFDPDPDAYYTSGQAVSITCSDEGASIYYTLSGEMPTVESVNLYTASITIDADTTISAVALKEGYAVSPVASGTYYVTTVTTAPTVPTSFSAVYVSGQLEVDLSWESEDVLTGGFSIERKAGTEDSFTEIADLAEETRTYTDTALSLDTTYYYRIKAYNQNGDSPYSTEESVMTDAFLVSEHHIAMYLANAVSVNAGDVDGDGDMDVIGASYLDNEIVWLENDGSGNFTVYSIDSDFSGVYDVHAADVDGDGNIDVIGAARNGSTVAWWENTAGDGSTWTEHTVDADFSGADSVCAADVDGDGNMDILGAARYDDAVIWWENTAGDGSTWTLHEVDTAFNGARSVHAEDMDNDGDMDILGAALDGDMISWWENTAGDGTAWTEHAVDTAFDGASCVYAADVNGDGTMDVLGAAELDSMITWWDGSTMTEHPVLTEFDTARAVYATDMDGDGDMDILGGAMGSQAQDIIWLENDGSENFTTNIIDEYTDTQSIYAVDMDDDGDMDVLAAYYYGTGEIRWFELVF